MTPSKNPTYDQTYCLLSVLQLKMVKFALAIIALTPILFSVEVFMGSAYLDFFYTYAQQNCLEWSWYSYSVGQWLEMLLKLLADQIMALVNLLQIFEWKAMLYLIVTQKNRTCGEILYDHNNENLFSRGSTNEQKNYRKNEMRLKTIFKVIAVIIFLTQTFF